MQVNEIETNECEIIMLLSRKEALLIMKMIKVEYDYSDQENSILRKGKAISKGTKEEIEIRQNMWDEIHAEVYY